MDECTGCQCQRHVRSCHVLRCFSAAAVLYEGRQASWQLMASGCRLCCLRNEPYRHTKATWQLQPLCSPGHTILGNPGWCHNNYSNCCPLIEISHPPPASCPTAPTRSTRSATCQQSHRGRAATLDTNRRRCFLSRLSRLLRMAQASPYPDGSSAPTTCRPSSFRKLK